MTPRPTSSHARAQFNFNNFDRASCHSCGRSRDPRPDFFGEVGEGRPMRFCAVSFAITCVSVLSISSAQAQWTEAKIPNEQNRTVQGCAAEPRQPGDWVCIMLRCDQPGSPLSLYFSSAKPELRGKVKLLTDDGSFEVSIAAPASSQLPFSTRAEMTPGNLIEAMKSSKTLTIENTELPPPHNRISMQNSRKAIEYVERVCTRQPSAARFWRRITRAVGLY